MHCAILFILATRRSSMPNLIDRLIGDRAFRHRFILCLYPFTIIGGVISVTCSLLARHYR
jgi:hypothetical protein